MSSRIEKYKKDAIARRHAEKRKLREAGEQSMIDILTPAGLKAYREGGIQFNCS